MNRLSWILVSVLAGVAVCIVLLVLFWPRKPDVPVSAGPVTNTGNPASQPAIVPIVMPTTFPAGVAKNWLSPSCYLASGSRMIHKYDTDGDGLYDCDEFLMYGTLRYDSRTAASGRRVDGPPRKVDPEDTDGDGLPDAWEMGYFGTLKYGPWDDPDGDGFPNFVELANGTSPVVPDLMDPKHKPKVFHKSPLASQTRTFSIDSEEFWKKQEDVAKRMKAGYLGLEPAVKGFIWKRPATRPTQPAASGPNPGDERKHRMLYYREMAKRPLKPEEDTDQDGLPDAWEMEFLGSLKYGPFDDPDDDGFPNIIEWYRGTDPMKADLLDPSLKPKVLENVPQPKTPWDIPWDVNTRIFWEAQERVAQRLKEQTGWTR
jgi:hypothetical protein